MNEAKEKVLPDNELDAVISEILDYLDEHRVRFSGKQLNDAGELFERYDAATARMTIEGKDEDNAAALIYVINRVQKARLSPDKASYLIRHLNQIHKHRRQMK